MNILEKIRFVKTEDNSTGLYDNSLNEIFHSKSGALREAYDKFINPVLNCGLNLNDKISVLDICFGIGYNSKALLSKTNNFNIQIDALEYNKEYVLLSPFISDCINNDNLKLFITDEILKSADISQIHDFISRIDEKIYNDYFSDFGRQFIKFMDFCRYKNIPLTSKNSNLHNIYYNYISSSMNNVVKSNKYNKCIIDFHYGDARLSLNNLKSQYDIVFLDAFSSKIDPVLWTIDFLSLVKSKMKKNSVLVSYSKASPFRSALTELGFNVGKTIIDHSDSGTIASLNSDYILNPLSVYDMKILKSRSGITYKDPLLNLEAKDIIQNREAESKISDRISRSQLDKEIKNHKYYCYISNSHIV